MEDPTPERVAGTPSTPEARAIEQALPRLAEVLLPSYDAVARELEAALRSVTGGAMPAEAPPDAPNGSPPPEPARDGRAEADPVLRPALAHWYASRAVAAMGVAWSGPEERARIVRELARRLAGPHEGPVEEDGAARTVLSAVPNAFLRDTLPARVGRAALLAVRHVLLGGPRPEDVDRTPTRAETANIGRRVVALLLDYSLITVLGFATGFGITLLGADVEQQNMKLIGYVLAAVGGLVNVQLIASTGTTLGKATMGIGIVRAADGGAPDLDVAFRREFIGRFLSQALFGAGAIAALFHPFRQSWGDRWAGTMVVRLREPLAWRRWAVLGTVVSSLLTVVYLPAGEKLNQLDKELGALLEGEGVSVISLTDSLLTLATRNVVTDEEMEQDLQAILALAPSVRTRASAMHHKSSEFHRHSRRVAPWNAGAASQIDSMFILAERCAASAEDFANYSRVARQAGSADAHRFGLAAEYAMSDLIADRLALRILGARWDDAPEGQSGE